MAEVEGPTVASALLDDLDLDEFHLLHAARADLLRRLGSPIEAARTSARAIELAPSDAESRFLVDRLKLTRPDHVEIDGQG